MGWYGNDIYGGDGTQTRHYDFCLWAGLYKKKDEDEWGDTHLTGRGTKLNLEEQLIFLSNIDKVIKKMPKLGYIDEYKAIEWQMLLALFIDNKMTIPSIIYKNGIQSTEYLMGDHASDFKSPRERRRHLRNFIKKAKRLRNWLELV